MKNKIYTVHAYRWGDREAHSYLVGVYTKKHRAKTVAIEEEEWRGGKYECEVCEWEPDSKHHDMSPGMPRKVIKPLPKVTMPGRQQGS